MLTFAKYRMIIIKDSKCYKSRTTDQHAIKFERNILEDERKLMVSEKNKILATDVSISIKICKLRCLSCARLVLLIIKMPGTEIFFISCLRSSL